MCESKKQMLYLSIHGHNQQPYIRFETALCNEAGDRIMKAEQHIEVFDKYKLLKDKDFIEWLGFNLTISSLMHYETIDTEGRKWAYVLYPYNDGEQAVLRVDTEPYCDQVKRAYCHDLPLNQLNMELEERDEHYKNTISEQVLAYLPQSQKPCLQEGVEHIAQNKIVNTIEAMHSRTGEKVMAYAYEAEENPDDIHYTSRVECSQIFDDHKYIHGADRPQALLLAIKFLHTMLAHYGYEIA